MNDGEKRAYSRGYNARAERWPAHKPPLPPAPIIARLLTALGNLRDGCDSFLATLTDDDPLQKELGQLLDEADEARCAVSAWLRAPETQRSNHADGSDDPNASGGSAIAEGSTR